jgi:hypothetical protein
MTRLLPRNRAINFTLTLRDDDENRYAFDERAIVRHDLQGLGVASTEVNRGVNESASRRDASRRDTGLSGFRLYGLDGGRAVQRPGLLGGAATRPVEPLPDAEARGLGPPIGIEPTGFGSAGFNPTGFI